MLKYINQNVTEIEEAAQNAESRKISAENEIESLSVAKNNLEEKIRLLNTDKDSLENNIIVLSNNKSNIISEIEDLVFKLNNLSLEYKQKANSINSEIDKLNVDLVALNEKVINLKTDIEVNNKINEALKSQRIVLLESCNAVKEEINVLSLKKEELIQVLNNQDEKYNNRNLEYIELDKQYESKVLLSRNLESEILDKKEKIKLLNEEHDNILSNVNKQNIVLEESKEYLKNEYAKFDEKKKELDEKQHLVDSANKKLEFKTQQLKNLIEKAKIDNLISEFKI